MKEALLLRRTKSVYLLATDGTNCKTNRHSTTFIWRSLKDNEILLYIGATIWSVSSKYINYRATSLLK